MKIAFIHYHLKTGGVTTCLKQQLDALKDDCNMCILSGEPSTDALPVKTMHIPELAYSSVYRQPYDPDDIAAAVIKKIETHFGGPCDIVHVHNPLLAKNTKFLDILRALQQKGINLLLQVHDFAEDGRARLYFQEDYPADCHYCVVNSRDYEILIGCGLKKEGLHRLFNSVSQSQMPPHPIAHGHEVVYPIRGIRRKNIGEAILLSLFFRDQEKLAITLPPNSSADIESYNGWKAFSAGKNLQVAFDVGLKRPFESIVGSARYLLTTSITEGFGFSFLEPWLFDKAVRGRKLPQICSDFESCGIDLDHMYTMLKVPIEGFDSKGFYDQWDLTIKDTARTFNLQIDPAQIRDAYEQITKDAMVDFGLLAEPFQKQVLVHLLSKKAHIKKLATLNPRAAQISCTDDQKDVITSNRRAVIRNYNIDQYRQNLLELYAHVAVTAVRQRIDKKQLVAEFFDLRRFSLLKWGNDDLR